MTDHTTRILESAPEPVDCATGPPGIPAAVQAHVEDILQNMTEGILFTDPNGIITFVNDALARTLGYDPVEMVGRYWQQFVMPEQRARAVAQEKRRAKGQRERYQLRLQKKDGAGIWALVGASPRYAARTGKYVGSLGVVSDINSQKAVEERLRESEAKYRIILEKMQEGYYEVDRSGCFTYINRSACEQLGYSAGELLGASYRRYAADDAQRQRIFNAYHQIYATGEPLQDFRWDIRRKDGRRRTVEVSVSLIVGAEGVGIGFRGISRDITETLQIEEERERLQAQLTQAQKMESVGRLAGGVAHDFNNMLGVIQGHAELALSKAGADHPLGRHLAQIYDAARRSADLTRQLLGFARKQTAAPRVLDLNQTIAGLLDMLRRLIGENIHLAWQTRQGIWPIYVDPAQVDQIFTNLCVNARDAICGTGRLAIETANVVLNPVDCAPHPGLVPGEYVLLTVEDDGCGMDEEIQAHLFEPFFTTKPLGRGTGLGLATVYGIVKQNNGYIHVRSEPQKGTRVGIYLPRYLGAEERAPRPAKTETTPAGQETVLLVEDEPTILDVGQVVLENCGYRVLCAATPGEAQARADAFPGAIDLLVSDVVMPEMNGKDLFQALAASRPGLKCLFMSGYTADVIAHHGVLDPGVHFIQKPFSIQALAAKVRQTLDDN
jgi:PAS domain S-box-containing protein